MRTKLIALALSFLAIAASLRADPSEAEIRKRIIAEAQKYLGVPYVYGAASASAFDCSGFVQYVYSHAADIDIPRSSKAQAAAGKPIDEKDAKPGDIFIYDTVGGGSVSHVALFLGGNSIIQAVSEGPQTGVIITPIPDRYFSPRLLGARYFIAPEAPKPKPLPKLKPAVPAPPELSVSQIGLRITRARDVVEDPVPAAAGSAIAFTIGNETGKDQVFHVTFYKTGQKYVVLREDRAMVKAGASRELSAVAFVEPGIYRLNVKTADNTQMMQRTWKVIALKP